MDSLDILLPRHTASLVLPAPSTDATAELEALSRAILNALQEDPSGYNPAYERLSLNHHSQCPDTTCHTRDDLVEYRARLASQHPEIRIEILATSTKVNERNDRAHIWLTCRMSGLEGIHVVRRESVVLLRWRKSSSFDDWVCTSSVFTHGHFEW